MVYRALTLKIWPSAETKYFAVFGEEGEGVLDVLFFYVEYLFHLLLCPRRYKRSLSCPRRYKRWLSCPRRPVENAATT